MIFCIYAYLPCLLRRCLLSRSYPTYSRKYLPTGEKYH